jgi:L-threonylcarbamoyladenylate synthase
LPCRSKRFAYLHCQTNSLAFRWPDKKNLIELIKKTGPLVAPSANPEGKPPAETIVEAKDYFKQEMDFYVAGGKLKGAPSTIVEIKNGKINLIREGKINKKLNKLLA